VRGSLEFFLRFVAPGTGGVRRGGRGHGGLGKGWQEQDEETEREQAESHDGGILSKGGAGLPDFPDAQNCQALHNISGAPNSHSNSESMNFNARR
jgi:hypothetical protein